MPSPFPISERGRRISVNNQLSNFSLLVGVWGICYQLFGIGDWRMFPFSGLPHKTMLRIPAIWRGSHTYACNVRPVNYVEIFVTSTPNYKNAHHWWWNSQIVAPFLSLRFLSANKGLCKVSKIPKIWDNFGSGWVGPGHSEKNTNWKIIPK